MRKLTKGNYACRALKSWDARNGIGYQYNLYENGKKVATVLDEGRGGAMRLDFTDSGARERLEAFVASLPPAKSPVTQETGPYTVEIYLAALADEVEYDRLFRRKCKTQTIFLLKSDPEGSYHAFKTPYDACIKAEIEQKYGDALEEIVNERYL